MSVIQKLDYIISVIWYLYVDWDIDDDDREAAEGDDEVLAEIENFYLRMKFFSLVFLLLNSGLGILMFFRLVFQFSHMIRSSIDMTQWVAGAIIYALFFWKL